MDSISEKIKSFYMGNEKNGTDADIKLVEVSNTARGKLPSTGFGFKFSVILVRRW